MYGLKITIGEWIRSVVHLCPPLYKWCLSFITRRGKRYYKELDSEHGYRIRLCELKDSKLGKSCFIIGNGPSLKPEDLDLIYSKKIDSFASNKIYRIFSETSWRPTYFSVVDWKGIDEDIANSLEIPYLFFSDYYWRKHHVNNPKSIVFFGNRLQDSNISSFQYSDDITQQVYLKGSVTYANFQIATYMGYRTIFLLGMDNTYSYVMKKDGKKVRQEGVERSHFYKDEKPSQIYAEKEAMDNSFIAVKHYADSHSIRILNATRGGSLEIFDRIDFDLLMKQNL